MTEKQNVEKVAHCSSSVRQHVNFIWTHNTFFTHVFLFIFRNSFGRLCIFYLNNLHKTSIEPYNFCYTNKCTIATRYFFAIRRPTHKADCVEKMATIWKVFESKLFRTMFPHRKEEERHANSECVHIHSHNYCTLQYSNDIFMAANRVLDRKTLVFVIAAQG